VTPILDTTVGAISGDPDRVQQIVWNLLSNAIKFTPSGGRVTVRLRKSGGQVDLTVEDNGPGIDPEFLPHVFDRFRQFDSSASRRHGGLGLGLAIVRSLTELHGGTVSASNGAHGGALLSVKLPLMPAGLADENLDSARPGIGGRDEPTWLDGAPSLHGVKVLVVEDEPDGRDVIRALLERCGAEVLVAGSGAEALPMIGRERPHVLVCDVGMPYEDGYSLVQRVRALPADSGGLTPAAALTAFAGEEDRLRALKAGFQVHLPKPVEPAVLANVIATLSGRKR
jgi:CheY-like chemotaxis protein